MYDMTIKIIFKGENYMGEKDVFDLLVLLAIKKGDIFISTSPSNDLLFIEKLNSEFYVFEEYLTFFHS